MFRKWFNKYAPEYYKTDIGWNAGINNKYRKDKK